MAVKYQDQKVPFKVTFLKMVKEFAEVWDDEIEFDGSGDTWRLENDRAHSLRFRFHFTNARKRVNVYFVDAKGAESQAIITLQNAYEVGCFLASVSMLLPLRANQKAA